MIFSLILHLNLKYSYTMAVTRLIRKEKRNRSIATNKVEGIKKLTRKPIIKLVDVEAIKAEFAAAMAAK